LDRGLASISAYDLGQNFPNPFHPLTTIRYELKEAVDVQLRIYDVMGQRVRERIRTIMGVIFPILSSE
jgi:hypothetical protein